MNNIEIIPFEEMLRLNNEPHEYQHYKEFLRICKDPFNRKKSTYFRWAFQYTHYYANYVTTDNKLVRGYVPKYAIRINNPDLSTLTYISTRTSGNFYIPVFIEQVEKIFDCKKMIYTERYTGPFADEDAVENITFKQHLEEAPWWVYFNGIDDSSYIKRFATFEDADLFVQCFMEKDMFTEMLHIN